MVSGAGSEATETVMASSSKRGGMTLAVRNVVRRSRMMARAAMEQAIRGQMGQPAASTMLSKMEPRKRKGSTGRQAPAW
jgi:hypothetical protein